MSCAYLDSAILLCADLVDATNKVTYAKGSVILYLALHAMELFLKGAILQKVQNEMIGTTHDITSLEKRYRNLYPGKRYQLNLFFTFEEPDFSSIDPDEIRKWKITIEEIEKNNPCYQVYRYPQDKKGRPWNGIHGFEPYSCLRDLKRFREQLSSISRLIFNE